MKTFTLYFSDGYTWTSNFTSKTAAEEKGKELADYEYITFLRAEFYAG